jgi:hypothetical protein
MSGKAEAEETKTVVPEAVQPAEVRQPLESAATDAGTPAQPRLRARLIETTTPAVQKDLETLQTPTGEVKVLRPASTVRPLARKSQAADEEPKYPGLERMMGVARKVIPVVQKVLPLLEGNVPLTVANLLAPAVQAPRRPVNLEPLETAVNKLHSEQVELQNRLVAQSATIGQLNEQVAALQEQADHNAREREEMAEGLRTLRRRVTWIALLGFVLLVASLAANGVLLVRVLGPMH